MQFHQVSVGQHMLAADALAVVHARAPDAGVRELGGEKLVGPGAELAPGTFWKGDNS